MAVLCRPVNRNPRAASASIVGVRLVDPKQPGSAKPTPSNSTTSTLGWLLAAPGCAGHQRLGWATVLPILPGKGVWAHGCTAVAGLAGFTCVWRC